MQKLVVQKILETFPNLSPRDVKSTSMGASGVDVLLSDVAVKHLPYSIECKSYASFAVYKHYEQAAANKAEGTDALLVIKQNRSQPLVVLSLDDFMRLYENR